MGKHENKHRPKRKGKLIEAGKTSDLAEGRGIIVALRKDKEIALFNANGKFYAIENFCPHKGVPLVDSKIKGREVECKLHGWRFDLKTGECSKKKKCSIEAYEVVVEDEIIRILI